MLKPRRLFFAVAIFGVVRAVAIASDIIPVSWQEDAQSAAAREALARPLDPVEFKQMPLGQLLNHLSRLADVSLSIRWPALNRIGIFSDSRVTMSLAKTTISAGMEQALAQVDRDGQGATIAIRDGIVVVSSKDDLARDMEVRVYDVSALLDRELSEREQREIHEAVAALWKQHYQVFSPPWHRQPRRWGPEGSNPALKDRLKTPRERETASIVDEMERVLSSRRMARIIRAIRETIEPESWHPAHGEASIEPVGTKLVIRQSMEQHAEIERLLNGLLGTHERIEKRD